MSKLQELINELCPDGVEYKTLYEVCSISKGVQFNKKDMNEEGTYPVINGGINPSGYIEQYNCDENTITISQGGASAGYVNFLTTKFWLGAHCYSLKPYESVLNRYLYHFVKANEYKLQECQYGAGIPALAKSTIASLSIPLPPLPVQEEIVRILDKMTGYVNELEAELEAELEFRKKQYDLYREKVLDDSVSSEWVPLLSIADTFTGLTYKPSDVTKDGTIVLRSSNIKNNKLVFDDNVYVQMNVFPERTLVKENDILICVRNGSKALIGKAALIPPHTKKMAFGAFMTILRAKECVNPRFLFYIWQSPRIQNMIHGESGMPINQITKKMLEQIIVPLPSLEKQNKAVEIFDRFNQYSDDISLSLSTEIENRQKQYEYYRDKLLNFKETSYDTI